MSAEAVRPLPAATLVLMRDAADAGAGVEVLLLRRTESAGFVPGAYVFPGGLVEPADCSPEATALVSGISAEQAADRLGLHDVQPPALAYVMAAVRETFEESAILVAGRSRDSGDSLSGPELPAAALRAELLEGRTSFVEALGRMRADIAGDELAYFAHWITPKAAPRRYDTRFFAARAPSGAEPVLDPREMTAALWTTPVAALRALEAGSMRMILPTIETLRQLAAFADVSGAFGALRTASVATNLPTAEAGAFAARPPHGRLAEP